MTRKITYICDCCEKEYPYELMAQDNDRGILDKILKWEMCRKCLKEAIQLLFDKHDKDIQV